MHREHNTAKIYEHEKLRVFSIWQLDTANLSFITEACRVQYHF